MTPIRAWMIGLWRVCRAPWLVGLVYVLLLVVTLPPAITLHLSLPEPARPFAIEPGAGPIPDYDWLDEVTSHKRSLLGELTPAVIGVAAPLSNIDRLLEGNVPMFSLLAAGVLFVSWAWLWGGVIATTSVPRRRFFKACNDSFSDVLSLNIAGAVLALLVYAVLRTVLFAVVWPLVDSGTEPQLLAWRSLLTVVPLIALAVVTVVFDYARIVLVLLDDVTVPVAIGIGARFVRAHAWQVALLVVLSVALLTAVLIVYGAFEFIPGGSVPTVRRIIELGQAYVIARIALRLWNASAQVVLFEQLRPVESRE